MACCISIREAQAHNDFNCRSQLVNSGWSENGSKQKLPRSRCEQSSVCTIGGETPSEADTHHKHWRLS